MVVKQLHLKFSVLRRSEDQSSVASVAYASGTKLTDERTGRTHDYSSKPDVLHSEIILPNGPMPAWAMDRSRLWNEAERVQRVNGQPARTCILSLSHQLNSEATQRVMRRWTQALCDRYGCAGDWALHGPDAQGDQRNTHAHVYFSTNVIDESGFQGKVDRIDWDHIAAKWRHEDAEAVPWARELFCRLMNQELQAAGIDERWDHRTLAEQRAEALRLATDAMHAADAARQKGDEPAAAEWLRKAEEYARHADECDREPTKKAGQASINRERQRYRLEHAEAVKLEAEARNAAEAAREVGQVNRADEFERKAQAHAERAREIERLPTSELIKRDVVRYTDTPPNGSDRVEMRVRAAIRRNAERKCARAPIESLSVNNIGTQVPTTPKTMPNSMSGSSRSLTGLQDEIAEVIVNVETPIPSAAPPAKHANKSKPAAAIRPKRETQLWSSVRPWRPTPQAIQAYKLSLFEQAYLTALTRDLAQHLKYLITRNGGRLPQLSAQRGINGGNSWISITLNDGGRVHDEGDVLLVKEQTPVAMIAMIEIARAKGWSNVELFGEHSFRRDAWLQYQLHGIDAHGYEPIDNDARELEGLRKSLEVSSDATAETGMSKDQKDQDIWHVGDLNGPDPNA
jgi:hypothetical protein